ncbi:MAG: glycosyltransferase family A protein, partial [Pseudomonadota bacterium]
GCPVGRAVVDHEDLAHHPRAFGGGGGVIGPADVSVILPVKNGAAHIGAAIESLARQSAGMVGEVLVIDDRSTDGTAALVAELAARHPEIRVLPGPGTGPAAARNVGLAAATGEVIGFIDHDDLWPPEKLAHQLARLNRPPHLDAIGGAVAIFEETEADGQTPVAIGQGDWVYFVNLGALLIRREVLAALDPFDPALIFGEDLDLMLRLIEAGFALRYLPEPTLFYRRHPAQLTSGVNKAKEKEALRQILMRTALRRRRAGLGALPAFNDLVEEAPAP